MEKKESVGMSVSIDAWEGGAGERAGATDSLAAGRRLRTTEQVEMEVFPVFVIALIEIPDRA